MASLDIILYYLASIIAVIFVFAPHEFAHAFVAYKCGDPTAKARGRMTLNPIKHLDPYGFLLCALTGFGWAKPVPIDPYNFHHYRRGLFLTAIAGVTTNYIIAFFAYPLLLAVILFFNPVTLGGTLLAGFLYNLFFSVYAFSLSVFIFNLLPLNPLDGFRVVEALTRQINPVQRFLRKYGTYILIGLVVESFLCGILESYTAIPYVKYFDILGYVRWFADNILGYPIKLIWNLIFRVDINGLILPY